MTDRHGHPSRIALAFADIVAATAAASGAYVVRFHTGLMDVPGRVDVLPANYLRALPIVIGLVALWVFFASQSDVFLTPRNLSNLLVQSTVVGIMAAITQP